MPSQRDVERLERIVRLTSELVKISEDAVVILRLIVNNGLTVELKKQAEITLAKHKEAMVEFKSHC